MNLGLPTVSTLKTQTPPHTLTHAHTHKPHIHKHTTLHQRNTYKNNSTIILKAKKHK